MRVESEVQGRELAKRILADRYNVAQIRAGLGRPKATLEELEEWLASGLAAKALVALKTKPRLPAFDPPTVTNLTDLLPREVPDPVREIRSWIGAQVVDSKGRPLPFLEMSVTDHAATDVRARGNEQARVRVEDLPSDELHTVSLHCAFEPKSGGGGPRVEVLPDAHEPCWMEIELIDRKGRCVSHLHPVVDGTPARPKRRGAFLAAGQGESDAWSVEVALEKGTEG